MIEEIQERRLTMTYEKRSYGFDVRTGESERGNIITGRPIVFGSWTDMGYFDETIAPGALDGADLSDVRFLVNHDLSRIPLARCRGRDGTMQMEIGEKGMDIQVDLDTEGNADARALYSAVKRGDISGMSFMFRIDGEEWEDLESDHPKRTITKIGAVLEVSAVTFPAYDATEIDARSRDAPKDAQAALDDARRAGGIVPDSRAVLELIKLKVLYGGK